MVIRKNASEDEKIFDFEDFPWSSWTEEKIKKLEGIAKKRFKSGFAKIIYLKKEEADFDSVFAAMDKIFEEVDPIFYAISFLRHVHPNEKIRNLALKTKKEFIGFCLDVQYSEAVFQRVKSAFLKIENDKKIGLAEKRLANSIFVNYKNMGFGLTGENRRRLKAIQKKIIKLSEAFGKNIRDYRDFILVRPEETEGLDENYLKRLKKDKFGNYIVGLDYPESKPFLTAAENVEKRKELAEKNLKKGGPKNLILLEEILELRREQAKLLGRKNYAELVLEKRMARKVSSVIDFLSDVKKRMEKPFWAERREMENFKKSFYGESEVFYYDHAFLKNKMSEKKFGIKQDKIKEYFSLERIRNFAFEVCSKIFSVDFKKSDFALWHKDAELYEVFDKKTGDLIGRFALDLFPREGKYKHMAVSGIFDARRDSKIIPFCCMMGNFPKSSKDNPSLFSPAEAETFFHEFGHIMDNIFRRPKYFNQNEIALDFIETPSQFLENWFWEKSVLKKIARHYKTGKGLSERELKNLIAAKNFQKAHYFMNQNFYGFFDMAVHVSDKKIKNLADFYRRMYSDFMKFDLPKISLLPASFDHICGYAAGYYSYCWSLVFAQDCFSRFKKEGIFNKNTGKDFRDKVLGPGDGRAPEDSLRDFLGRKPNASEFIKELKS